MNGKIRNLSVANKTNIKNSNKISENMDIIFNSTNYNISNNSRNTSTNISKFSSTNKSLNIKKNQSKNKFSNTYYLFNSKKNANKTTRTSLNIKTDHKIIFKEINSYNKTKQYISTTSPNFFDPPKISLNCNEKEGKIVIIWISIFVNDDENSSIKKYFLTTIKNLIVICCTTVDDGIDKIKDIFFKDTYIILESRLFNEFTKKLKLIVNELYFFPKIIVFTRNKTRFFSFKKNNISKINDPFYNLGGIVDDYKSLISFIKKRTPKIDFNKTKYIYYDTKEFTFEYIENETQLIAPLYISELIINEDNKYKFEEINNFNNFLIQEYGNESIILELINQIININIPDCILVKYWLRLYTLPTHFYVDMNTELIESKQKDYEIFIKMLYLGLKKKYFNSLFSINLFRGARILNSEIENINSFNKKIDNLPICLVFTKSFMSFSSNLNVAKNFMNNNKNSKEYSKVLYILNQGSNVDSSNATNADLNNISYFKNEKEILFFPFSVFGLHDIKIINTKYKGKIISFYYKITLTYLGAYHNIFKGYSLEDLLNYIPYTPFTIALTKTNLISEKIKEIIKKNEGKKIMLPLKSNYLFCPICKCEHKFFDNGSSSESEEEDDNGI